MSFTIGSLFDGSGGFPLSAYLCGGTPKWASEVEPYPIAVTRSRFPNMKHLGDISKINGAEVEPVDVVSFGSPCQDLSVAGRRAGIKHEVNGDEETTRSGLFMEAVRIIKEMREASHGKYPRFALWENVPGAFSSNKGEDFRIVLEELIKIVEPGAVMPEVPKKGWAYADSMVGDGWSLAYRVFDAQYWGVPQRRRRIHLVLDLGGECAREVLFERESLRGHLTQGRAPWQGTASDSKGSIGADDRERASVNALTPWDSQGNQVHDGTGNNVYPCLRGSGGAGYQAGYILATSAYAERSSGADDRQGDGIVTRPVPNILLDDQGGQQISVRTDEKCPTLRAEAHGNVPCVVESAGFKAGQGPKARSIGWEKEKSPTLAANAGGNTVPAVAYSIENHPADSRVNIDESGKVQTLTSRMGTGGGNVPLVMEKKLPDVVDVEMEVAVRKYEVDRDRLIELLRSHKGDFTNAQIAEALHRPLTLVEHWFRSDKCFAVPDPDIWFRLKRLLGIETTEFDACITEYEFKGGNYDMRNRIYTGEVAPTLTGGCGNHLHLVSEPVDSLPTYCMTTGSYMQVVKEVSPTLMARDYKDPNTLVYWDGTQTAGTLTANNAGGNQRMPDKENFNCVVDRGQYVVRRLTPTECARLQGFPDLWGHFPEKSEFTEEEYAFWQEVRNTHAAINDKVVKEYTEKQMLTWYNKLHTDSAEYKMWGNGIALPPALYCMEGIAEVLNESK